MKKTTLALVLTFLVAASVAYAQGIPLKINYQGKVEVDGIPFNGVGQFKFALTNQAGDTYYWTNDGTTPTPPASPTNTLSLNVSGGLYSLDLGDTSLTNMSAVPVNVFSNPGVFLRVWFNDGVKGEQRLMPDKQLTSVSYAYMAEKVAPLSIEGKNMKRESVWPEHEGRSNTVVSYFFHIGVSERDLVTIPANKTFVITDIYLEGGGYDTNVVLEVWYEVNTVITYLGRFRRYDELAGQRNRYPEQGHLALKSGLPVPTGAVLKVKSVDSGSDLYGFVAGFEFQNN